MREEGGGRKTKEKGQLNGERKGRIPQQCLKGKQGLFKEETFSLSNKEKEKEKRKKKKEKRKKKKEKRKKKKEKRKKKKEKEKGTL